MNTAHEPATGKDGAPRWRFAAKVSVIYGLLASAWVVTADWILALAVSGSDAYIQAHAIGGVAFVLISSAALFVFLAQPASLPLLARHEAQRPRPAGSVRNTRKLILTVMILLALLTILIFTASVWRERTLELSQSQERLRNYAHLVKQYGDDVANTVKATLASLVTVLELKPELMTPRDRRLHKIMRNHTVNLPLVRAIWILDRDGNLIHDTDDLPGTYNLSAREYFQRHRLKPGDEAFFDTPIVSILGKWTLVVSRRIPAADGGFAGVIAAALELDAFDAFHDSLELGPQAVIGLATLDGRIVSQSPAGDRLDRNQPLVFRAAFLKLMSPSDAAPSARSGYFEEESNLVAFHRLKEAPFVAYIRLSKNQVLAAWHRRTMVVATAVLLMLGLLAGLGFLVLQSLRHRDASTQAIEDAEERLWLALESAEIGILDWDITRDEILWSRRHEILWGYAPGEPQDNYAAFRNRIHPEDTENLDALIKQCMVNKQQLDHEFRVLWPDTSVHWVHATGQFYFDEAERPVRMIGTARDISRRRQTHQQLHESKERFRSLTELSSDWYWEQDASYRLSYLSSKFSEKSGVPAEAILGRCRWDFAELEPKGASWQSHMASLRAHQPFRNFEYFIKRPDGSTACWSVSGEPVFDARGRFAGYRGTGQDITRRYLQEEQMQRRARCDRALGRLGEHMVREDDLTLLHQEASEQLADALQVELVKVLQLEPNGAALKMIAGVGWQPGKVGSALLGTELSSQAGFTLVQYEEERQRHGERFPTVVVADLNTEVRFTGPLLLREHGVVSGISVVIPKVDGAWGVLGVHTRARRNFASHEVEFVQTVAFFLSAAIERINANTAMQQSESRFRSLTELSTDWYWEQDAELRFTSITTHKHSDFTPGVEAQVEAQVGTRSWDNPRNSAVSCTWEEHRARLAARKRFRHFVYILDERSKHLAISGEPVFDSKGVFCGYRGVMSDISSRVEAQTTIELARERMRMLLRRVMDAQEAERSRLVREMHDTIGQQLTALALNIAWIRTAIPANRGHDVDERIVDSAEILEQAIRDLRNLAVDLRPPGLDEFGLVDVLLEHARREAARSGIRLSPPATPPEFEFPPSVGIALFRIAQEAINNVIKHSGASEFGIEFQSVGDDVVLTITDDGRGFDLQSLRRVSTRSLGMTTMRERAEAIGASFHIQSSGGHGTRLSVTVPGGFTEPPPAPDSPPERVNGASC